MFLTHFFSHFNNQKFAIFDVDFLSTSFMSCGGLYQVFIAFNEYLIYCNDFFQIFNKFFTSFDKIRKKISSFK